MKNLLKDPRFGKDLDNQRGGKERKKRSSNYDEMPGNGKDKARSLQERRRSQEGHRR